jgi:transposase
LTRASAPLNSDQAGQGPAIDEPIIEPEIHPQIERRPKEELRLLYHLPDADLAPAHLDAWLTWATRSRPKPFVRLARTLRTHRDGILAAIRLGLSNGRLEALNSKIRLISHRAFGFHSADPLIALVYLCCAGITIQLPR